MAPPLRALALGTLVLIAMASCSTGQVNSVWSQTSPTNAPYRSLILFGLTDNPKVRRAMEDNFISALTPRGVKTHVSHFMIGESNLKRMGRVLNAVALSGADGVLVTHLIAEETADTPPPPRLSRIPDHYEDLEAYFGRTYRQVCAPHYYAGFQALRLESNLYDATSRKLIWSGRSRQLDPNSEETTISEVIATLADRLEADGLLPPSPKPSGQIAE